MELFRDRNGNVGGRGDTPGSRFAKEGMAASSDSTDPPQVGIFWLVERKLVIDGTPLAEAEPYDRYLNDPRSHFERWEDHRKLRVVPIRADWAVYPRGRVVYDTVAERFRIYADLCILSNPEPIAQVKAALNLPPDTEAKSDDHYRCAACMHRGGKRRRE